MDWVRRILVNLNETRKIHFSLFRISIHEDMKMNLKFTRFIFLILNIHLKSKSPNIQYISKIILKFIFIL